MIDYKKAQKILINSKINIKNEIILTKNSINRVSAKNIYSPTNYPAGNNTAFDGYAINSKETSRASSKNIKKFKILKTLAAGDNPRIKNVKKFSTIEVMTGALISKPFDTVIPIEAINFYPDKKNPKFIIINKKIPKNNYRKVEKWANKIGVKTINVPYDDIDPFFNINTKEDLIEAEKILKNYKHD